MTCREKLKMEHPECVEEWYTGGCQGCPHHYNYLPKPSEEDCKKMDCEDCWDRKIPGTEEPEKINPGDYVILKPWEQVIYPRGIDRDIWDLLCELPLKVVDVEKCDEEGQYSEIIVSEIIEPGITWYIDYTSIDKVLSSKEKESFDDAIKKENYSWDEIHKLIDDAMTKRDRSVSLYFNPGTGMSVNVYPWPDAEDLYEQYRKGLITENDFREKMGLPRISHELDMSEVLNDPAYNRPNKKED